jgi:putative ABC transport system permease protein
VLDADVPLAVSVTAFVVGLAIATLFVATTMGLVVEAERRELAVLASVGFTPGARFLFVVTTTMTLAFLGGIGGIVVGTAGVFVLNIAVGTFTSVNVVGVLTPRLLLYGLGVSVLTGLLSSPYPVLLARRTDISAELGR